MLQSMRNSSGSWIAKGILGLLVLSFLGWGIADYTHVGMQDTTVARVGDREIDLVEFVQQYQQMLRSQNLQSIDPSVAQQLNLAEGVLQGMAARILYEEAAQELDLTASDSMVREAIQNRTEFQGLTGQFDRNAFSFALANLGIAEADFVEFQRRELAADGFIGSVLAGSAAPEAMTDLLFSYFGERRDARYFSLTPDEIADPISLETPSEAAIADFFQERGEDFRRPELRSLRFVLITPERVAQDIDISQAVLEETFEQRRGEFEQPEQRAISQIVFPSEEEARGAAESLAGLEGDALRVKAEELGLSIIDLGTFAQSGIPNPALGDAAFALDGPGVSEAFEGAFGWSVAIVTDLIPGANPTLEDVADALRNDLALDQAYDEVFALGSLLEDAYGAGVSLAQAARDVGLEPVLIDAVDASGRGPDGQSLATLPAGVSFLQTAFALEDGEISFLETTEANAQFMVEVVSITPSAIPALNTVREEVISAWRENQKVLAVETMAKDLQARLNDGAAISDLAAEAGVEIVEATAFSRDGQVVGGSPVPTIIAQDLFAAAQGDAVMIDDGVGFHIAVVEKIKPAGSGSEGEDVLRDTLTSTLARGMGQDLVDQWGQALQNQISIETFPAVYNQVYQF